MKSKHDEFFVTPFSPHKETRGFGKDLSPQGAFKAAGKFN
jgi:hypothetical protein